MDDVLTPGILAGGYRIERLLRRGGMGAVYAAVHPVIGKRAAVKVIDARVVALTEGTEPFVEEARLVNQIGHPNIVDVFGFESLPDGRPLLIMELLEGETVRELLARRRRLSTRDAVSLIMPVLDALGAAHRAGIVHRDLKPENVFLVRTIDERVAVKVLDFGVARLIEAAQHYGPLTGMGTPAGTPAYMSPEQCRGQAVDGRSDLYAVGLLLFELITGRSPLPGGSPAEYLGQQLYAQPARLGDHLAVDPALDELVSRLLAKDPARRPESAEVLAGMLSSIVPVAAATSGGTVLSVPVSDDDGERLAPGPLDAPLLTTPFMSTPTGLSALPEGTAAGPAGENRLVTVLFADVQGFTTLSEKMPPEEVRELIDRTFRELTVVVERFGGRVDKYIGDCVMAVFGVPRSRDDDAERAVEAALEMQAALERLSHRARRPGELPRGLSLRIGVNTGRVFAGTVGGENRRDFTVIGDAVNVAARLQTAAPKGAVAIGAETWRHVRGHFTAQRLEPLKAKGRREPVEWFRVFGPAAHGGDPETHRFYGALTRFFARDEELAAILRGYERAARTGRGQMVTVLGPSGSGKSRLRAELVVGLRERHPEAFVLQGRPSHRGTQVPYELVASFFRSRFPETADAPEAVSDWIRQVQRWARNLAGLPESGPASPAWDEEPTAVGILPADPGAQLDAKVADLAGVLGLSFRSRTSPAPAEDLGGVRERISASVATLLGLALDHGPVVLLADDLDHADEASLDLLEDMLVHLQDRPFMVVGFAGPELADRRPRLVQEDDDRHRLDLSALSPEAVEAIARDLFAGARGLTPAFLARLVERADGSPLVLKETVRVLIEAGAVTRDEDGALRVHPERVDALELPSTIYGIVQARLDRLAPEERMLLMRAAVVGRTFWEGALLEMVGGGEAAASEVRHILERLRSRDLVRVHETSRFSGDREFVFKEATTRDVAYEALSQRMRQHHHRAVARWLAGLGEVVTERNPALLALHHDRGGELAAAVQHWIRAGHQASGLGRHEEALGHYGRAREILDETRDADPDLAEGRPVEDLRVASWEARTQLRIHLGDTLRRLERLAEAEQVYQAAMGEILREERRVGNALEPHRVRYYDALVELRLGMVEKARGTLDEALGCYEAALDRLGSGDDVILRASIHTEIAWAQGRLGRPDDCLKACARGLWAVRKADPRAAQTVSCVSRLHQAAGDVYQARGDQRRARRHLEAALAEAEAGSDLYQAGRAYEALARTAAAEGDLQGAARLLRQALELKERLGDLYDIALAHDQLAELALLLGRAQEAEDHLRRAVRFADALDAQDVQADAYRHLAELRLSQGRPLEALDAADRALDKAQAPGGRGHLGEVAVAYARCCVAAAAGELPADREERVDRALIRARGHLLDVLEESGLVAEAARCREIVGEPADVC